MAPDVEELIKKINTLTLDKNRLRQKLTQLSQQQTLLTNNNHSRDSTNLSLNNQQNSPNHNSSLNETNSPETGSSIETKVSNASFKLNSPKLNKSSSNELLLIGNNYRISSTNIAGIECSTSCEDDLLFMNELYRKRLDEYNENWDYIQSKCTALLSELNALQEHYSILKKEKLDLQEKLNNKCDECDQIKSELQTVVLNYETQLSAMSDHLSTITSQINLND